MARKVKCQITKEYGTSDVFFKAENGKYYKTEEIYKKHIENIKTLNEITEKIMLYTDVEAYNSIIGKLIKELHQKFNYQVILDTVKICKSKIEWAVKDKNFKKQSSMFRYIFAIIKSNIDQVNKSYKHKQKAKNVSINIDTEVFDKQKTNTKKKDISKWL